MSIYVTWVRFEDGAAAPVDPAIEKHAVRPSYDDEAPWVYRGSHLLPTRGDTRAGIVTVSGIPDHIDHGVMPPHAWLRIGVDGETVVIDRTQAAKLRDMLDAWLAEHPPSTEG